MLALAAALQGACSLLIEVDDGGEDERQSVQEEPGGEHIGGPDTHGPGPQPSGRYPIDDELIPALPSGALASGAMASGEPPSDEPDAPLVTTPDAGTLPPEPPPPPFDLAFIEQRNDSVDVLRIVSSREALASSIDVDANPPWRRTLQPADQVGDALDFAWAPGGERLAVRYSTDDGARIAFFAAPEWQEVRREDVGASADLPNVSASANYRWSPNGEALAVELTSAEGPHVAGYTIDAERARAMAPVGFTGPIESMNWVSSETLFVIQPEAEARELVSLTLNENALGSAESLITIGLLFPTELRSVPTGLVGASSDPEGFFFFWPGSSERSRRTYRPNSYVSATPSFVAEPDSATGTTFLYALGGSQQPLDELPDCPTVLAWTEGPDPSTLAASRIACLRVADAAATLEVYAYDASGVRTAFVLDDASLSTAYATPGDWESHARGFSRDGEFLALATAEQDVLVDLRGAAPAYQVIAAEPANTARGFSPSGRYLLEQRGSNVDFVVLAPAATAAPFHSPLGDAAIELAPCNTSLHAADWCGAPQAASRAGARWSSREDVASFLSLDEGLAVLTATDDGVGVITVRVSTCENGCVEHYEFRP